MGFIKNSVGGGMIKLIFNFVTAHQKIMIYAVVIAASLWGYRQWLNKHDDRVAYEAKQSYSKEQEAKLKQTLKVEMDKLESDRDKLELATVRLKADQDALEIRLAEDAKHRQREDALYNQALSWSKLAKEKINADVTGIPAANLVGAILAQSAKLPSTIRDGIEGGVGTAPKQ